jgi:hypothetical protein
MHACAALKAPTSCVSSSFSPSFRRRFARAQTPSPATTVPFVARLLLGYANGDYFTCGATLVSPTSVLTAAHCLHDTPTNILTSIVVRLGAPAPRGAAAARRHARAQRASTRIHTHTHDAKPRFAFSHILARAHISSLLRSPRRQA